MDREQTVYQRDLPEHVDASSSEDTTRRVTTLVSREQEYESSPSFLNAKPMDTAAEGLQRGYGSRDHFSDQRQDDAIHGTNGTSSTPWPFPVTGSTNSRRARVPHMQPKVDRRSSDLTTIVQSEPGEDTAPGQASQEVQASSRSGSVNETEDTFEPWSEGMEELENNVESDRASAFREIGTVHEEIQTEQTAANAKKSNIDADGK